MPELIVDDFVGGEGMGEPCSVQADKFFTETGLMTNAIVDADQAIEKINFQYMNDLWSRQQANHWFNWLGKADTDDDDMVTFDEMVEACQLTYGEEFFFEEPADADYLRDHPLEDLTEKIGILLDKDHNGDVNLGAVERNLPPYVEDGTLTQEEADMYLEIV